MNYFDKMPSAFFGILQREMSEKGAFGDRKRAVGVSQASTLRAIDGILVPNLPYIAVQYDVYCDPICRILHPKKMRQPYSLRTMC